MSEASDQLVVSFLRKLEYFDKPAIDAIADMIERGEHLEQKPETEPCEASKEKTKPSAPACPVCHSSGCILSEEECQAACDAMGSDDLLKLLTVEDFQRVLQGYLNSQVCMSLFSNLTLMRACGENPRVVVKRRGMSLRVQLHRVSGEVLHFNRDGKP